MSSKRTATQVEHPRAKAQCTANGSDKLQDPVHLSSSAGPHSSPAKAPPTPQRHGSAQTPSPSRQRKRWYFNISYSDKDEAKKMGAKWDADAKQWYAASSIVYERLVNRFAQSTPPSQRKYFAVAFEDKDQAKRLGGRYAQDVIVAEKMAAVWDAVDLEPLDLEGAGEDRTFGGVDTLYIDLLPHSSHGKTLMKLLPDQEFARLKSFVITRAKGKCECCEECKRCTHLGVAAIKGEREEALDHFQKVRQFDTATLLREEELAWQDHYSRDSEHWTIDLSLLENAGLHPSEVP